jgi:hypothetical protein
VEKGWNLKKIVRDKQLMREETRSEKEASSGERMSPPRTPDEKGGMRLVRNSCAMQESERLVHMKTLVERRCARSSLVQIVTRLGSTTREGGNLAVVLLRELAKLECADEAGRKDSLAECRAFAFLAMSRLRKWRQEVEDSSSSVSLRLERRSLCTIKYAERESGNVILKLQLDV